MPKHSDHEIREAVKQYVSGLTITEVARVYRVNESTASQWMRSAGVTRPRGSTAAHRVATAKRVAALLDLATSGDSVTVVAARQRVPRGTLASWVDLESDLAYEGDWEVVRGIQRPVAREAS